MLKSAEIQHKLDSVNRLVKHQIPFYRHNKKIPSKDELLALDQLKSLAKEVDKSIEKLEKVMYENQDK